MRTRLLWIGPALLSCAALSACTGGAREPVLTLQGSYSGTTSSSCQLAVRTPDNTLVDAHSVPPSFRQEFTMAPGKGHYYAQLQCPDGKMANIPQFDFEPPRASIELGDIPLY